MSTTELSQLLDEALRAQKKTPYSVGDLTIALRPFLAWAIEEASLDADLKVLLSRRNIELFISTGVRGYKQASIGNLRSRLLRLAEVMSPHAPASVRLAPLPPADPLRPYGVAEVASLISWAASRSTAPARRSAEVLLALGLGAGLSALEIGDLRNEHITSGIEGVLVRVEGPRSREVWMLDIWGQRLATHLDDSDDYAFRPGRTKSWPNVISNFVGSGELAVRPQSQRMRATWMVEHLNAGTNIKVLAEAAGVESLESFARYLRFVEPLSEEAVRLMLRRSVA